MNTYLWFAMISAVVAIVYGVLLAKSILKLSPGNEKMQAMAKAIAEGAKAYLNRQYKTIGIIAVVLFFLLFRTKKIVLKEARKKLCRREVGG